MRLAIVPGLRGFDLIEPHSSMTLKAGYKRALRTRTLEAQATRGQWARNYNC